MDPNPSERPALPIEYRRWLRALLDEDVDFLLVGGLAVGIHGYPRVTRDIDVWVEPDPENARRVMSVAESLGDPLPPDAIVALQVERRVLHRGEAPFRVDLMTSCDGCVWDEAKARAVMFEIDGMRIPTLSLRDLRAAKAAAGRHKDLDDLENLPPD